MFVHYWAVIPAAGIGARMDVELPKQYLKINGKTILEHTLEKFCQHPLIDGIIIVIADNDIYWSKLTLASHPKIKQAAGGIERCDSVLNGPDLMGLFRQIPYSKEQGIFLAEQGILSAEQGIIWVDQGTAMSSDQAFLVGWDFW